MLISNEADRLVYEPGLAGRKIASDDEPRFTLSVTGPFLCDYERFLSGRSGGAHNLASAAVTNALLPLCVEAVLANPAAVAELKVKRLTDYDDEPAPNGSANSMTIAPTPAPVVRDHLKTIGTYKTDLTFWRACGKLLEGKVDRTASK